MLIHQHESLDISCCEGKRVLAIGLFDGCHNGHKTILKKVLSISKEKNAISAILTFTNGNHKPKFKRINHPKIQEEIFKQLGLGELHYMEFNESISSLSAEDFLINFLIKKMNIDTLVLGSDAKLGNNRSCTANEFKSLAKQHNINVVIVDLHENNDLSISSTRIRNFISKGDINKTNELLGYSYMIGGIVYKDQQKGREIGFPTANIDLTGYAHLPKGVYSVLTEFEENKISKTIPAIAYIGTRPSVTNEEKVVCEIHIPNWEGDLYDQFIKIFQINLIRPEQKFKDIKSLKDQIHKDILQIKQI